MADPLSNVFAALADPTRRAIVDRLRRGPATLTELAEPFDMTVPGVAKHIRVLERAGLILRGRDAQRRPCSLAPAALEPLDKWLEHYRVLWDERLERLAKYTGQLVAEQPPSEPPSAAPTSHADRQDPDRRS